MLNHVSPHSQFPSYQQNWGPPAPQPVMNHVQGKNAPPSSPQSGAGSINSGGSSPRPLNHLKQHLLHKGGYGSAPSPTPPQGYGNGPSMHPPMGPPSHHMGPPHGPASMGGPGGMVVGPGGQMVLSSSMGPGSQLGAAGQMGPVPNMGSTSMGPPSTHNAQLGAVGGPNSHSEGSMPLDGPQDNGVSSSGSSSNSSQHPVTSIVTTGPDGAPMDEASQQSTLSNASAGMCAINVFFNLFHTTYFNICYCLIASDDPCSTPKSRKNEPYNQSHLAPPSASPGAHAQHEDYDMSSPTWPRTPASPVSLYDTLYFTYLFSSIYVCISTE